VYYQNIVYDYVEGEGRRQNLFDDINRDARGSPNWLRGALFMPVNLR
jgi:hypothetical protein